MVGEREVNVSSEDGRLMPADTAPREVDQTVSGRSLAAQVIYLLLTAVIALLSLRFILSLFGANKTSDFANFIYDVSNPLVRPFYGIFGSDFVYGSGTGRIEWEVIMAAVVYTIVAVLLVKVAALGKRNVRA